MFTWLRTLFSGKPHFIIGSAERPYLLRWYLIPRNPFVNVYLHKFLRDDDDRALHDHPWSFISIMLRGGYEEFTPVSMDEFGWTEIRQAPSIAYRPATHQHRVVLFKDNAGCPVPCWTIVITGPKCREWGFWCPKGFVPWHVFCDRENHGSTGKGCGS